MAVVILVLACIWQRYKRGKADKLREEHRAELATLKEKDEKDLKQRHEQNGKQQAEREEENLQEIRHRVVDELINNPDEKRPMTIKIGRMVISIPGKEEKCEEDCDMIDGPIHTNYTAHSKRRPPMLTRGTTLDLDDDSTSIDSGIQEECVVDCMKSIVKASMTHPKIGPALKRFVSTEIGVDTSL